MQKLIAKLLIVSALVLAPLAPTFSAADDRAVATIKKADNEYTTFKAVDPGGNGGTGG